MSLRAIAKQSPNKQRGDCFAHPPWRTVPGKCARTPALAGGARDDMQTASLRGLQPQTQEELDALLPSVLDKAFKGEL